MREEPAETLNPNSKSTLRVGRGAEHRADSGSKSNNEAFDLEPERILMISGLSLSLDGTEILHGVDLEVLQGDFTCIVGPNGAGKSSLLKCVAGIYKDYRGQIVVAGHAAEELRAKHARELARRVAYVPQSAPQDLPFTVTEFVDMARYPWRTVASRAEDERAVASAMEITGIADLAGRKMGTLSGGERQKVLIASAIAQETEILLLDEPTTYLDYAHQVETMELISRINRDRGATIVAVTHDVNFALQAAGTVLALVAGRAHWSGQPIELLEPGRLRGIYGVTFEQYFARGSDAHPFVAPVGRADLR